MLAGDFFIVKSIDSSEDMIRAKLELNPSHPIFEGHFPGQPVVPGVCMMQIIKELLEMILKEKTRLIKADSVKFLSMIDPRLIKIVDSEIKYTIIGNCEVEVFASLFSESTTFFKYRAVFITVE
jgi:3-hydroxyacyl-[acyl-carrier-protein] dehydratase